MPDAGPPTDDRLQQLLSSDSAAHEVPAGEPRPRPSLDSLYTVGALVLQLAYTGERMQAADTLQRMLGVEGQGEYVGLWAATTIVTIHGGSVRVVARHRSSNSSSSGGGDDGGDGGAVVVVELPMSRAVATALPSDDEASATTASRPEAAAWQFRGESPVPATAVRAVGRNSSDHGLAGAAEYPALATTGTLRVHIDADAAAPVLTQAQVLAQSLAQFQAQMQMHAPSVDPRPLAPLARMARLSVLDSDSARSDPQSYSIADA